MVVALIVVILSDVLLYWFLRKWFAKRILLSDVLDRVKFCSVFCRYNGEEFYEYATMYYNPEAENLIIVCDSDHSEFNSHGLTEVCIPNFREVFK